MALEEIFLANLERCIKQHVPNAKRNAKFLSSPAKIVRYIARIVSRSVRILAAAKNRYGVRRTAKNSPDTVLRMIYERRYPIRFTALAIRAKAIPTVVPSVRFPIQIAA